MQIRYEGIYRTRLDTVSHIPREISRFVFYFIEIGGMVEGIVTDMNDRKSPRPSGGFEIKLKVHLYFRHSSISLVEQLRSFIAGYNYDLDRHPVVRDLEDVEADSPHIVTQKK